MREFVLISVFTVLSIFSCHAQTDYSDYDYLGKSVEDILSEAKSATDSDGFIREDRIWHLRQVSNLILAEELFPDYSDMERWYYCFFMDFAFSGTKEFHGKTYNVCYAWYTNEDIPYKEAAPIGFMREEGSKIYSYCPPGWEQYIYDNYHIDVMRCGRHIGYWEDNYPEDCEVLIYDFSLENGDYLFYNEDVYSQFIDREDYHKLQGLAIDNVKDIEIDGKTYKSQDYSMYARKKLNGEFYDDYTHFYTVLSSVGPLNGYPCYPSRYSYTLSKSNIELINITDLEGNMIFDYSPWLPIPDAVDNPSAGNVVRTVYHDLLGRETENHAGGLYIRTRIYDSGRQVTDKVVFAK